jgi:hypothetical protein
MDDDIHIEIWKEVSYIKIPCLHSLGENEEDQDMSSECVRFILLFFVLLHYKHGFITDNRVRRQR